MYHIALMTEGEIKSLARFDSYSAAEEVYDDFCDKYPNGWVEIISEADFQISQ
jgi:TolA-binding protein